MKKRIFAAAAMFLALAGGLRAQSPYHHIGDEVFNPDSIYWHNDYVVDDWLTNHQSQLWMDYLGLLANPSRYFQIERNSHLSTADYPDLSLVGELLRCCYTADTIKVIGLAAVAYTCLGGQYYYRPAYFLQDTLLLYGGTKKNLELLRKVKWSMQDSSRWMRPTSRGSIIYPHGEPNFWAHGGCCTTYFMSGTMLLPLKEYYFEDYGQEAVYITDSFFVGCTHSSYTNLLPENQTDPDDSVHYFETGYFFYGYDSAACDSCTTCESFPEYEYLIKRTGIHPSFYPLNEWITERWRWYLAVWPIIDIGWEMPVIPPYACPSVENIRTTYYNGAAVIQWDADTEHDSWQYSYGPQGVEPDSGTIVNCPIQVGQIYLDTGVRYSVYVRAKCTHDDSIYFSQWSDGIDLFIPTDTTQNPPDDTTGIDVAANRYVTLMPNPAHGEVQVVSSFGINRVEVYNIQGKLMEETNASGITVSISTKDWPSGTYFAIVHTPAGSFSKRLVVKK
jgi:hypothetical protein